MSEGLGTGEAVRGFASTLVPLLLDVWVEASASDRSKTDSAHLLTPDAMSLMYQVLSILQLLHKLAPQREHQETLVTHTHTQAFSLSITCVVTFVLLTVVFVCLGCVVSQ